MFPFSLLIPPSHICFTLAPIYIYIYIYILTNYERDENKTKSGSRGPETDARDSMSNRYSGVLIIRSNRVFRAGASSRQDLFFSLPVRPRPSRSRQRCLSTLHSGRDRRTVSHHRETAESSRRRFSQECPFGSSVSLMCRLLLLFISHAPDVSLRIR